MKFSTVTCCLWLVSTLFAYAQTPATGWVSGYVVVEKGDTLRGELFNRDADITPSGVRFRATAEGAVQEYGVNDLWAFYLQPSQERFIRHTVRIDNSPYKIGELQNGVNPAWNTETLWLKEVVRDELSLFFHHDKTGKKHFWVKPAGGDLDELVLITYRDLQYKVRTQHRYRQQLFLLANGCPTLQKQAASLPFKPSDIEQFVRNINNCRSNRALQTKAATTVAKEKIKTEWGVQAGVTQTTIHHFVYPSSYTTENPISVYLKGSPSPGGGLWLNLYLPRNRQQWSVYGALTYQGYKLTSGEYKLPVSRQAISSEAAYVKLLTAIRWQKAGLVRWQPFVLFGVTNGIAFSLESNLISIGSRRYEQGLVGGVGLRYGRGAVEVRHERGNGTLKQNNSENVTGTRTTGLFLSYSF